MNIYDERPQTAATSKVIGGYVTHICLEIRELTKEEMEANGINTTGNETKWTAHCAVYKHIYPLTENDYNGIVSAIVRSRYSSDEAEAIMNNYLQETDIAKLIDLLRTTQNFNKLRSAMSDWLSSRDQSVVDEYDAMQEWRDLAKNAAREAIENFRE